MLRVRVTVRVRVRVRLAADHVELARAVHVAAAHRTRKAGQHVEARRADAQVVYLAARVTQDGGGAGGYLHCAVAGRRCVEQVALLVRVRLRVRLRDRVRAVVRRWHIEQMALLGLGLGLGLCGGRVEQVPLLGCHVGQLGPC